MAVRVPLAGLDAVLAELPPFANSSPDPVVLDAFVSTMLFDHCSQHRLGVLLGEAVAAGRLVLSGDAANDVEPLVRRSVQVQVRVESGVMLVLDELRSAGIDLRVLKGLATAHLDYPNPAHRSFGDGDVLVRAGDVPDVIRVLDGSGLGAFRIVRGGDWRIQHAITFVVDGVEIDLHHRLLHQAAGHRAARLDLFAEPERLAIAGRELLALPRSLRLLQAAAQNLLSASNDRKLSSDLDLVLMGEATSDALERASEVGLGWLTAEGIRRARERFDLAPLDPPIAATTVDRLFARVYGVGMPQTMQAAALEFVCAPPATTARIVRSIARPGDAYLEQRGRTTGGQVGRQLRRVVPGRPR